MLIGPDNFTRPPASQRQRWDAEVPLERTPAHRPVTALQAASLCVAMLVGALFWTAVFAWWLS